MVICHSLFQWRVGPSLGRGLWLAQPRAGLASPWESASWMYLLPWTSSFLSLPVSFSSLLASPLSSAPLPGLSHQDVEAGGSFSKIKEGVGELVLGGGAGEGQRFSWGRGESSGD